MTKIIHHKRHGVISIQENFCMRCGVNGVPLTRHHSIPKRMKPKMNVTVPLCKKCHDELNLLEVWAIRIFLRLLKGILSHAVFRIDRWESSWRK